MKNLVVYYSFMGSTEVVAKEIHQLVGGDLIKIEEVKPRKKGSMMGPAFSALLGLKSRLKKMDFTLAGYENIFLGVQVWAARSTPAINTFLSKADLKNKKVYLFVTKADEKIPQAVIDSIARKIEKRGGKVVDSLSVTTRMDSIITPDTFMGQLTDWIKKAGIQ
jgi:flavodoxin